MVLLIALLELLVNLLGVFFLYAIISVIWQQLELKIYGKITPRILDDIVAVVLAISLYFNFT